MRLALIAILATGTIALAQDNPPVMKLLVDESQAARRIAFVREEIRVHPGTLTLAYPRWIPGEHGPTGPVQQLATIRVRSGDRTVAWTRDPEEIYTIHLEIPQGVDNITVEFDTLLENTISDHQLLLAWNTVILYPLDIDKRALMIQPSVDGRAYASEILTEAIAHPRNGKISLIVRNFDSVETRDIQYPGGLRYPHLERIPDTHDYLTEILAARNPSN